MGNLVTAEQEILNGIVQGKEEALDELFKQFAPHLFRYARSLINDSQESEEIVQEVFVKLWKNRVSVGSIVSIKSYLMTATRNHCLNFLKSRLHKQKLSQVDIEEVFDIGVEDEEEPVELLEKIQSLLDQLPPQRRKIFEMSRYEELKYKEIAEKLGISVKTVHTQICRTLEFLRKGLEGYM